ncbi:hypothetical protein FHR54_002620 [Xanthomonas arboricola]
MLADAALLGSVDAPAGRHIHLTSRDPHAASNACAARHWQ